MSKLRCVFMGLVFVALAGCSDIPDVIPGVTVHSPGVYKGAADPLLSANTDERVSALNSRFNSGQTDR